MWSRVINQKRKNEEKRKKKKKSRISGKKRD
jgi:hypothetical protein